MLNLLYCTSALSEQCSCIYIYAVISVCLYRVKSVCMTGLLKKLLVFSKQTGSMTINRSLEARFEEHSCIHYCIILYTMPRENYVCGYCGVIKLHFFQLTRHLTIYHENAPNFVVQCNADGCKSRYRRVDSCTKHFNRQHKSFIQSSEYEDVSFEPGTVAAYFNENPHIAVAHNDAAQVEFIESGCRTVRELFDNVSSHVSKVIISVREQHLLPSVVHERIASSMHSLVASALTDYASVVKNVMQVNEGSKDLEMLDILNIQPYLENFGEQFKSEYHLCLSLKETGQIIMPSTVSVDVATGKHTFQYVSLLEVLQKFLSLDVVYSHIHGRLQLVIANDVLSDYCDGDAFHSDDFFTANPS